MFYCMFYFTCDRSLSGVVLGPSWILANCNRSSIPQSVAVVDTRLDIAAGKLWSALSQWSGTCVVYVTQGVVSCVLTTKHRWLSIIKPRALRVEQFEQNADNSEDPILALLPSCARLRLYLQFTSLEALLSQISQSRGLIIDSHVVIISHDCVSSSCFRHQCI